MNNCYQKAEKLSKLPIYTKESFTLQHKKQNYWDYIDFKVARIEHNNFSQVRNYFERLLAKYENKPFSEIRSKVLNNSKFKHNKFFRKWSLWYLKDLEEGVISYRPFHFKIENGILVKSYYPSCRWYPSKLKTEGRHEIKIKDVKLILKDGFFYKPSPYMYYESSKCKHTWNTTLRRMDISCTTILCPHDRQLNKKELKYYGLTNINGAHYGIKSKDY